MILPHPLHLLSDEGEAILFRRMPAKQGQNHKMVRQGLKGVHPTRFLSQYPGRQSPIAPPLHLGLELDPHPQEQSTVVEPQLVVEAIGIKNRFPVHFEMADDRVSKSHPSKK